MKESEIARMGEQEKFYWWHVSRRNVWRAVFQRWLPPQPERRILDVGCGAGINLQLLREWGEVTGIDLNPMAVKLAGQYGRAQIGDALALAYPADSQDLITVFDLLEHLPDDAAALREWHRVLKSGGYLMVSAPAYQWLFGPHDRALSHYRRYTRPQLTALLRQAGFTVMTSSYLFMFTFPIFVLQRLLARGLQRGTGYNPAPAVINSLLILLGRLEAALIEFISLPFGSSVIVLARKA